jgi:cell division protein FtsW
MGDGASMTEREPSPQKRGGKNSGKIPAGSARARRAARTDLRSRREGGLPIDYTPRVDSVQQTTTVPPRRSAADRAASPKRSLRLGIDVPLLLVVVTLVFFGLIMLFSASWKYSIWESGEPTSIFVRQVGLSVLGIGVAFALGWLNYHRLVQIAVPLMVATLILLVVVLILQEERHGAVRSLMGGSIQPSELAKLATIIYLSVWLYNRRDQLKDVWLSLVPLAVILGLVGGFIAIQPDLSAVITVFILGGMMFFLAGGDIRQIAILIVVALLVGFLVMQVDLFPTGTDRMDSFIAGLRDPLQASDHVQRSMEAFVKGGWFGVGIGKASTKLTVLPFPHTDSIFAVVGEETGVLGAGILVILFALLMWRGLLIAHRAPDLLGSLLAGGLTFWLAFEAFVNMAVMVGLMPFAGNALPFVSAGGSNRIVSLAAIGILMNISRMSVKNEEEEKIFSAVIDLCRRDWRRSFSRPRRPAKPGIDSGKPRL